MVKIVIAACLLLCNLAGFAAVEKREDPLEEIPLLTTEAQFSERLFTSLSDPEYIDYDLVKDLLELGVDPNTNVEGVTVLQLAIEANDYDIVELLIKYGCDVNMRTYHSNQTPLTIAAISANYSIAELLINNDANVNEKARIDFFGIIKKQSPLAIAILRSEKDLISLLLSKGAELTKYDRSLKRIRKWLKKR